MGATAKRGRPPTTRPGHSAGSFCLRGRAMTNEQQALAERPIWLVIALSLVVGVSGEMWRADKDGARGWALLRRLALHAKQTLKLGGHVFFRDVP